MVQKKREERLLEACLGQETNGVMTAPVSLILPPISEKSAPCTKDHGLGRPEFLYGPHPTCHEHFLDQIDHKTSTKLTFPKHNFSGLAGKFIVANTP